MTAKIGDRFDRLTVVGHPRLLFRMGRQMRAYLRCVPVRCICGTEKEVWEHHLCSGRVRSCGCLRRETARRRLTTHGQRKSRLYQTWNNMLRRCEDQHSSGYAEYGAKE